MKNLEIIRKILSKHYDLTRNKTYIFGSRSSGTHRNDSDLDILIDDIDIAPSRVALMEEDFDESNIFFKVDIILKSRIDDKFFEKIKDELQNIMAPDLKLFE